MNRFQGIDAYLPSISQYHLLPFRFTRFDQEQYILTNLSGEYFLTARQTLLDLLAHRLPNTDPIYCELRARQFLMDETNSIAPTLISIKVRTRFRRLAEFTGLHLFVVTLRCEHSCPYCQVSRRSEDKLRYDMSAEAARAALDLVFRSPSTHMKIEFQGGEPLLNFPLIQFLVNEAEARNLSAGKELAFVIATNLALLDEEILNFCRAHSILISTSLDGPRDIHNANRPRPGGDSYERTIRGIALARRVLGHDRVSALMTTTEASLPRVRDIIDEYITQEFGGIFLRPLSPYGFAIKTRSYEAYKTDQWLKFYREGIDYIIQLNREGHDFTEYYAATILRKMLTSEDPGYVDLMSPAGLGIGAVVYNYDGSVYASDEGRMLAEMGKEEFKLGHVLTNTYEEIFTSPKLLEPLEQSFAYTSPICNDCAFEPYCGADPVFHYALYGDYVGRKPESEFCHRNMETFRYLILKMESDPFIKRLFTKWANR
jgi:His-Xaa-Ser system radical SAM maturase HxsB